MQRGLEMCPESLRACSYENWFPSFRTTGKFALPSVVIPLSADFVRYLKSDGVILPRFPADAEFQMRASDPRRIKASKGSLSSSWEDEEEDEDETNDWCFPEIEQEIDKALNTFKGSVFPKLNYSCPRDASWMGGGTLECRSAGEIFVLLKSSDFCQVDLQRIQSIPQVNPVLVLKKFHKLNPSMEFRCIVRNGILAYICQRDCGSFYPFLLEADSQQRIVTNATTFIHDVFLPRFPHGTTGQLDYLVDIYFESRDMRCWLVDCAPLAHSSPAAAGTEESKQLQAVPPHPLLSWEQVLDDQIDEPKLIIVRDAKSTETTEQKVLAMHRVPVEFVNGNLSPQVMQQGFDELRRQYSQGSA